MSFCIKCGHKLDEGASFCSACGAPARTGNGTSDSTRSDNDPQPQKTNSTSTNNSNQNVMDNFTSWINNLAGGSGSVRPPLKTIFSEVFSKHTKEQTDELFICGTSTTTPELTDDEKAWPHPWLWSRILLVFLASFAFLYICASIFSNSNSYPGLMFMGSFAMPIAVLIFFFELNTPRNISFYNTIKYFLVGGCASLLSTLFLFEFVAVISNPWIEAMIIGVVEEVGKLVIVAFIISRSKKSTYLLNGLLIGAAVGAGFAAFESAGYAFNYFLSNMIIEDGIIYLDRSYDAMIEVILLRGGLAPGGHVIWAAMTGYAIIFVKNLSNDENVGFGILGKSAFWKIFIIPIVLHAVWDMPISFGESIVGIILVPALLTILGWVVVFVLMANSLSQIGIILKRKEEEQRNEELFSVTEEDIVDQSAVPQDVVSFETTDDKADSCTVYAEAACSSDEN